LVANIRVGQDFAGGHSAYLPSQFERFDLVYAGQVIPVTGRLGDRPAMTMPTPGDGLVIVVHQTVDNRLSYSDPKKFENFTRHKDFTWALDEHKKRGLPEVGFREVYSRYAKSLMMSGNGEGADQRVGLLTEIVALANPYTDDLTKGLPVRVLYQGEVRPDTQVELFEKDKDGKVVVTLHRTNGDGVAELPMRPGREYLVDSVVMRAVEPASDSDPVWESLWASLTFMVPK